MDRTAPSPHDLLLVSDRSALRAPGGGPLDQAATTAAAGSGGGDEGAWVVVRRATRETGWIPVGIRGAHRSCRFPAQMPADAVACAVPPARVPRTATPHRARLPAFRALHGFSHVADTALPGHRWGPGGSVGFELVTGQATVTASSDLDVLLLAEQPLDRTAARQAFEATARLPTRVDLHVLTPNGGFALEEWLREPAGAPVVLRTDLGPRLVTDIWPAP
ncbi:malonate decarboxylase holo-ACP synthase [Actinoplanes subtropicus]|uniref:malonate decarboxylase holo-ACP synthase n=1 Tax=Actinoplanes subtropicus TaxID=543632 RepID=UPI000554B25A|nr:malonate decarboxylase holo-ACP synthase [Actinoplanes subtropicus]